MKTYTITLQPNNAEKRTKTFNNYREAIQVLSEIQTLCKIGDEHIAIAQGAKITDTGFTRTWATKNELLTIETID